MNLRWLLHFLYFRFFFFTLGIEIIPCPSFPFFVDPYSTARIFLIGRWCLDPSTFRDCFANVPFPYSSFYLPFSNPVMSGSSEATASSVSLAIGERSAGKEDIDLGDVGDEIRE